ncbi:unnamed protein product [Urochloa humidicola]
MATAAAARRLSASSFFAAARRLSSSASAFSASTITVREVTESHKLTIQGYTQSKKIVKSRAWTSPTFQALGRRWQIWYGHEDSAGNQHISLYLSLLDDHGGRHAAAAAIDAEFKFSLLDRSGNPVPEFTRATAELCSFNGDNGRRKGFGNFVKWRDLEASGCLEDDRFSIRCDITAAMASSTKQSEEDVPAAARVVVPPSDLSEHLAGVLWEEKHGTDVTVDVIAGGVRRARVPPPGALPRLPGPARAPRRRRPPPPHRDPRHRPQGVRGGAPLHVHRRAAAGDGGDGGGPAG